MSPFAVEALEPLTYTTEQLAARLQISVRTVHEQRRAGVFPFAPIVGLGAVRWSRAQVEAELADPARRGARRRSRG